MQKGSTKADRDKSAKLVLSNEEEAEVLAIALQVAITNMRVREGDHRLYINRIKEIYAKVAASLGYSVEDLDDWMTHYLNFDFLSASNCTLFVRRGPAQPMELEKWEAELDEAKRVMGEMPALELDDQGEEEEWDDVEEEEWDEEEEIVPLSKPH